MSRRQNNIRGPHSALTDFLAANNISARQIRDNYEQRRAAAAAEAAQTAQDNENGDQNGDQNADMDIEEVDALIERARRDREAEQEGEKKSKEGKDKKKKKGKKKKVKDSEDEGGESDSDADIELYSKKAKKLPGQLSNCEICDKRFTVTPYSKSGPDGGLLCNPCGKELAKEAAGDKRKADKNGSKGANKRRRNMQSERLDGIMRTGPKSLVQHCLETVVKHHDEIESFDNMPEHLIYEICKLLSKLRVIDSKVFSLFLKSEESKVIVYDCAKLKTEDYQQIFTDLDKLKLLVLHNAYQFKDSVMDCMIDRATFLNDLRLYGANLVSNEKWSQFFRARGFTLQTLKLRWLDAAFEDQQVADMVKFCPNLVRLKLEYIWRIGPDAIKSISKLKKLEHLSLECSKPASESTHPIPIEVLVSLIKSVGRNLRTLSLRNFNHLDDKVLAAINSSCRCLQKLRISPSEDATDEGYTKLFTNWPNPPLHKVDLSANRDIDNQNPDGPEDEPYGLAANSFKALMVHSGVKLQHLDISSCRHITLSALLDVFVKKSACYPLLERVDLNFVKDVDEVVLAGVFRSAAASLRRVELFGCFNVKDGVIVPSGVVVIGAPFLEDDGMEVYGAGAEKNDALIRQFMRNMDDELDELMLSD